MSLPLTLRHLRDEQLGRCQGIAQRIVRWIAREVVPVAQRGQAQVFPTVGAIAAFELSQCQGLCVDYRNKKASTKDPPAGRVQKMKFDSCMMRDENGARQDPEQQGQRGGERFTLGGLIIGDLVDDSAVLRDIATG